MKVWHILVGAAVTITGVFSLAAQNNTEYSISRPPERYQGETVAAVLYLNNVGKFCNASQDGYTVLACTRKSATGAFVVALPNPCSPAFAGEAFAHIVCHENAHTLGWTRMHEE